LLSKLNHLFQIANLVSADLVYGITPYMGFPNNGNIGDEFLYILAQRYLSRANFVYDLATRGKFIQLSLKRSKGYYLVGGGTLLFGKDLLPKFKNYSKLGLKPILWGTGSRELHPDYTDQEGWKSVLSCAVGSVRGHITADSFHKLGVDVNVIGDMGFLVSLNCNMMKPTEDYVVIVPRLVNRRNRDLHNRDLQRLSMLTLLIEKLYALGSKIIIYMPSKDDLKYLSQWLNTVGNFSIIQYAGDAQTYLMLAQKASLIVTMRMHPGIFGYALGVPIIFLESRSKYHDAISILENKPALVDVDNFSDESLLQLAEELIGESFESRVARYKTAKSIAQKQVDYCHKIESMLAS
jgi:polysaccharide pyruvyl transferase WcaK-like protein